jgi:hypothetical protein
MPNWPLVKVYGSDFTKDLQSMYEVITELELWNYIRDNSPDEDKGYMFTHDETIHKIGSHPKVIESGHSGATYSYAMRIMQRISHVGFDQFKIEFNASE